MSAAPPPEPFRKTFPALTAHDCASTAGASRQRRCARQSECKKAVRPVKGERLSSDLDSTADQFGTFTAPPATVIASAPGFAEISGRFAVVSAGAEPGVPPRDVARTTCDGGSAAPFFR